MKTKELVIGLLAGIIITEGGFTYGGFLENPYDYPHLPEKPYYILILDTYISRSAIGATATAVSDTADGTITIDEMPIKYFDF